MRKVFNYIKNIIKNVIRKIEVFLNRFPINKKHKKLATIGILVITACLVITLARYVINITNDYLLKPRVFYFTSDILKNDTPPSVYYVYKQTSNSTFNLSFDLRNYEDSKKWSNRNINYNLNITADAGVNVSAPTSGTITYNASQRTAKDITMQVTLPNTFGPGDLKAININATATSPFKKNIQGKINIVFKEGMYEIEDQGLYVLITIYVDENVNAATPEVVLNLNNVISNVQLDMTNNLVKQAITLNKYTEIAGNITSVTLGVMPGNNYQIKLFKSNGSYTYVPDTILPIFNY